MVTQSPEVTPHWSRTISIWNTIFLCSPPNCTDNSTCAKERQLPADEKQYLNWLSGFGTTIFSVEQP